MVQKLKINSFVQIGGGYVQIVSFKRAIKADIVNIVMVQRWNRNDKICRSAYIFNIEFFFSLKVRQSA